jgi:hypothetical protein
MSLRGQQQPAVAEDLWQCLIIVRHGTHYALPAEIVRGLGSIPPGIPRSDLLAHFPGVSTTGAPARVVLCGLQSLQQAVLVDEVLGLTQVARMDIRALPAQFTGAEQLWFSGLFLFQSTVALVVNPEWLLVQSAQELRTRPTRNEGVLESARGTDRNGEDGVRADQLDGLTLEEASDAEDTPWAEL